MIALLLALLAVVPPSAYETNSRGAALLNRGEPLKALESFREARAAAPEWITPPVNEAIALLALGRMDEALAGFDAALARDPSHVHALFNRGLARKRAGLPGAEADFARVHEIDPTDPDTLYQLATARMDRRDHAGARDAFEELLRGDPAYLSAYFALGRVLLLLGEREKAQVYLDRFQEMKAGSAMAATVGPAYGEQGVYSLAEDVPSPPAEAAPAIRVVFRPAQWGLPARGWAGAQGVALVDLDGDGRLDLAVATAAGLRLFRNAGARFVEVAPPLSVPTMGLAAGDVDADGDVDLLAGTERGSALLLNQGGLRFTEASPGLLADGQRGHGVAMVDVDHDGDLDLLVARDSGVRVLRSTGTLGFTDVTAEAGLAASGAAFAIGAVDIDGDRDVDLIVSGPAPYALINQRDGTFKRRALDARGAMGGIAIADLDGDRVPDLVWTGAAAVVSYGDARVEARHDDALPVTGPSTGIAPIDFDNDGLVDLAIAASGRLRVLRNLGGRRLTDAPGVAAGARVRAAVGMAAGDIDGDGDLDLVVARDGAAPLVLRNDGGNANAWLVIDPRGLNDNKTGVGTRVEVRTGGRFQRGDVLSGGGYLSQAPLALHFGLGPARSAAIVRLLWPTGVLQDELDAPARATLRVDELDRKGSSCPILYAWDGSRMRFVADIIGAGVMGQWAGPGARNVSDPDEYLLAEDAAPDEQGRLRFALVEQMEEVTYLDAARVVAVDHPSGIRVLPNERFTGAPPFPAFGVVQTDGAWPPVWARDESGADVTDLLRTRDDSFVRVPKIDLVGFARPHHVEIDLGPRAEQGVARLVLRGYTEYFYPRTLYAASQRGLVPEAPVLEVLREGAWVKIADLGIPAGLPRYMVVDVAGLLHPGERRLRIASNMEVYWDQILADDGRSAAAVRTTTLVPSSAELAYHGFPRRLRRDPEAFDFQDAAPTGPYARAAGLYTRYGDVTPLLGDVDDTFAILGPGDAVTLTFDGAGLPALPDGWRRSFFFFAHGYEKDMDDYTALPLTVGPLPFRGMSTYPYPVTEAFPSDAEHLRYQLRYNTRRVDPQASSTPTGSEAH